MLETDLDFQSDDNAQCGALTGDTTHQCTRNDGHTSGRHVEHDASGLPMFGWREGAETAFHIFAGATAAA